jgi:hypothetical protein
VFGVAPTEAGRRLNTSAAGAEPNAIVERRVTDVEMHFSRELEHGALDESARGYVEAFRAIEQMRGAGSDADDSRNST